ncbi:MAG: hypothetical protein ABSG65_11300 [Bryobacteraceae bacterium]|jgi:hypothetical protein
MGRTIKTLGLPVAPLVANGANGAQRGLDDDRWIDDLIKGAKAEQARSPMDVEALLKESGRLASYGAQRAKRLGIKATDLNRIVHEHRKLQRG